jgi:hypothetical protein
MANYTLTAGDIVATATPNVKAGIVNGGGTVLQAAADSEAAYSALERDGQDSAGNILPTGKWMHVDDPTTGVITDTGGSEAHTGDISYVNLSGDNLSVLGLTDISFIKTGAGNDTLTARNVGAINNNHNILDGGAGNNTFSGADPSILGEVNAVHTDAFIMDSSPTQAADTIFGFTGKDIAIVNGINPAVSSITVDDVAGGVKIDAIGPTNVSLTLQGFSTADFTVGKFQLGFGTTSAGTSFMFVADN